MNVRSRNSSEFIPAGMLPLAVAQRTMNGPCARQHTADSLRRVLLYLNGGIYLNCSGVVSCKFDRFSWTQLDDPNRPFQIAATVVHSEHFMSAICAAQKGYAFLKRWQRLFVSLWSTSTSRKTP
jgi:hypothetical protein